MPSDGVLSGVLVVLLNSAGLQLNCRVSAKSPPAPPQKKRAGKKGTTAGEEEVEKKTSI